MKVQNVLDTVVRGKRCDSFMGEEIRAHDEQEAERLLLHGLVCCGLSEADLPELKKGDDRKKVISWYIRKKQAFEPSGSRPARKWVSRRTFSCYVRAVEQAKEGLLWVLKNKMMN